MFRAVIDATDESAIIDRPPIRILGRREAEPARGWAHPTTPNLGQGACQTLEDAVVLAARLTVRSPAYVPMKNAARKRTALVTTQSWFFGEGLPMAESDRDMVAQPEFPHKVGTSASS